MSETKHTQREWFVDGYWVREREPYDEAGHRRGICKIMSARSRYGEAATNARLIAAAPTMLEALKKFATAMRGKGSVNFLKLVELLPEADAAIKLAEGATATPAATEGQ